MWGVVSVRSVIGEGETTEEPKQRKQKDKTCDKG
jgi:hypothetical protein